MNKIFYTLIAAVFCLMACQKELTENLPVVTDPAMATVAVPFSVTIPVSPDAVTRAGERYVLDMEEPVINNLYIAVFGENGGMLQQLVPATLKGAALDHAGYQYKCEYVAQLPLYDDECHLHFIGNYNGDVSSLTFEYEKTFMDNLSMKIATTDYEVDGKTYSAITSMPDGYWQKVVLEDGIKATYNSTTGQFDLDEGTREKLDEIALVRNYAKITVSSASRDFTINSYALVNVPLQGTIAPWQAPEKSIGFSNIFMEIGKYCDGTYDINPEHADHPDQYPNYHNFVEDVYDSGYIGYMANNDLIFTGNPGESSAKFPRDKDNGLYMYERTEPTKAGEQTGVIVCLTWADDLPASNPNHEYSGQTMYYKIEVLDEDGEYMPILRNIYYNISLTSLTGEGAPTFDVAYSGAFFGNVSSSIETATLTSIDDNKHQIVVNRMDFISFSGGNTEDIYFQFYPDITVANPSASSDPRNYQLNSDSILPVKGYNQAIDSVGDIEYIDDSEDPWHGWMHVQVTLKSKPTDGSTLRGKLRVRGVLDNGVESLYRDVVFTVMSTQNFTAESSIEESGSDVTVNIGIPSGLSFSLFPLQVKIEAQYKNLSSVSKTVDGVKYDALPVKSGESGFNSSKNSFYYIKTIQYKEYAKTENGEYEYVTKFPCFFVNTDTNVPLSVRLSDIEGYFNEKVLPEAGD